MYIAPTRCSYSTLVHCSTGQRSSGLSKKGWAATEPRFSCSACSTDDGFFARYYLILDLTSRCWIDSSEVDIRIYYSSLVSMTSFYLADFVLSG